ncbi:endothelin-converting enzyme homolog isoform X1 [Schistocerca cancellata]|uniref:endothelin-converting enzyme homolog isoform X1 n=2 Tax=Schistocerca cancellata TaxID=274614 RepID=UPI002118EDAF|nr:endothelin-converting enzyme homolog isoform X1 [Schistocerca cancellata]
MSVKMARYKQAEFDDDASSVGSVQLTGTSTPGGPRIRFRMGWSLWQSRTLLERLLLVVVGALLLALLIVSAVLLSRPYTPALLHAEEAYCVTMSCVTAAASVLSLMDETADPCTDFYQYACGGWVRANPIPDSKSMWGTFVKLEQQNQLVIKNVLEQPMSEFKSEAERKAKLYYMSCLDVNDTIETLGPKPMLDLLEKIGGWNITGNFSIKNWSLQKSLETLQNRYNMGGLFTWAVGEDDRDSKKHIIQIDQGGLTLPTRDNYLNGTMDDKVLSAYLEYMTKIGVLLGGEEKNVRTQMKAVIKFETELAKIMSPQEDRRDEEKLYNNMELDLVQAKAPFIDWHAFFSNAMENITRKISKKENVVVYAPEYLEKLNDIIKNYTNTTDGKIILNNYLVWQTVRSMTSYLSKAFRDAYKGLRKALVGSEGGEKPWRYCVTDTNNVIGFAIGAMFVREAFHGNSKPAAENMINQIRTAFKNNLKNLKWMDAETRRAAERKADAITDMIGFPDYILNPAELDQKYKDLEIKEDEYFENNIRVNKYNLKSNLEKLDQPVNKTRWGMTPPTVNAYYTPTKNQIVFPAGILQAPFYDIGHPKSMNYGAMGVVMGHELTHAFDDQGREYDQNGNLHKWWNNQTIEAFKERAQCVVNQYSSYTVDNKHVNGKQTLGENIADNGGLKAAYHAYLEWEQRNPRELPLPGLNFSHKQLFFLSFAQVWCSASTEEAIKLQLEKDPHAPPKFRVIGPLSNLHEFSSEFRCPLGSKMNPLHKCEVW